MVLDTTRDIARKGMLAALGALTLADDEFERLIDRLAERGEAIAHDGFKRLDETMHGRLTSAEEVAREGVHDGAILSHVLQEELEQRGRWLAAALNLPTRDSIEQLHAQINQLSAEIEALTAARAAPPAPLPGYEDLNAKEAAAKVSYLDAAMLQAVRNYEVTHRNRVTVLRAIDAALAEE